MKTDVERLSPSYRNGDATPVALVGGEHPSVRSGVTRSTRCRPCCSRSRPLRRRCMRHERRRGDCARKLAPTLLRFLAGDSRNIPSVAYTPRSRSRRLARRMPAWGRMRRHPGTVLLYPDQNLRVGGFVNRLRVGTAPTRTYLQDWPSANCARRAVSSAFTFRKLQGPTTRHTADNQAITKTDEARCYLLQKSTARRVMVPIHHPREYTHVASEKATNTHMHNIIAALDRRLMRPTSVWTLIATRQYTQV